jgi:hypothetical protein
MDIVCLNRTGKGHYGYTNYQDKCINRVKSNRRLYGVFSSLSIATHTVGITLNKLFSDFHVGVEVFFVLSGFLITYNYYGKISMERESILGFYKNVLHVYIRYTAF